MNKKIIYSVGIIFSIVVALLGVYFLGALFSDSSTGENITMSNKELLAEQNTSVEQGDKVCQTDDDCVHVMTECSCDCGIAVNKKYQEKYLQALIEKCKNYQGRMCKMRCNNQVRCASGQCVLNERAKHQSHLIPPAEFKNKLESGEYVLVDIRTSEEDTKERIPGEQIVLDFYKDDFEKRVSKLDRNKKYLYYCRTGHRSGQASELAEKFNFTEAYELEGGITAWKKAGYKTESTKKD